MMIDEDRRTKIWHVTTTVSLIAALAIIAFFVIRIMTNNPVRGNWSCADSDVNMSISSLGNMTLSWPGSDNLTDMTVKMKTDIDRDEQTIKTWIDANALKKAAERAGDPDTLRADISRLCGVFTYEGDGSGLTLTDTQSGDTVEFVKAR